MTNNLRWQVPGNANPFSEKLENWHIDNVSTRSIGTLDFINQFNPSKELIEIDLKNFLLKKYNLAPNDSQVHHFYRPLEFIGLVIANDNKLFLSVDGINFLNNIFKRNYEKAYQSYLIQLLKTKYPNSATKDIKLKLFPYRILFKLFIDRQKIHKDDFITKIPYIKNINDINNYNSLKGEDYQKLYSWTLSYFLKWEVLQIDKENFLSLNKNKFPIINDIVNAMPYDLMFYEEDNYYYKKNIRQNITRNYELTKKIIENSNYKCFFDHNHHTFPTDNLPNYLEGHHIIPISNIDSFDFDLDVENNIIAVCPNCHRKIHLAKNKIKYEMIEKIFNETQIKSLNISQQNLLNLYLKI